MAAFTNKRMLIKGDLVELVKVLRHDVWIERTEKRIQELRDRDAAEGRWHDEGGEPIIYGPYDGWPVGANMLMVLVTELRPKWKNPLRSRPKNLKAGITNIDGARVRVLFCTEK